MNTQAAFAAFVKPRWASWLGLALERAGQSDGALARELAAAKGKDQHNDVPRSNVRKWLNARVMVSAESAYDAGTALQALGHPYASGLLALTAAGHYLRFARVIRALVSLDRGEALAPHLILEIPLVAEADISEAQGWSKLFWDWNFGLLGKLDLLEFKPDGKTYGEHVVNARHDLAKWQQSRLWKLVDAAWNDGQPQPRPDMSDSIRILDGAVTIAGGRKLPHYLQWGTVAHWLSEWVNESMMPCTLDAVALAPLKPDNQILQHIIYLSNARSRP